MFNDFRLIVGLGNPGPRFHTTRHNAGFLLVDRLIDKWSAKLIESNQLYSLWEAISGDVRLQLMKPMTYMNLSGNALLSYPRFEDIDRDAILVAYDDVALPVGRIRVRPKGTAGGQRGMQHIVDCLGTTAIPRLRIGIGAPGPAGPSRSDYVLGQFGREEWCHFQAGLEAAEDAAALWLTAPMDLVMNRFNVKDMPGDGATDNEPT